MTKLRYTTSAARPDTGLKSTGIKYADLKNTCTQSILALFLSQSLSCISLPALADTGYIKIAGQSVFSIISPAGTTAASKRAQTIQDNLDNALVAAKDRTPATVNIAYVKGSPIITLGGYQVATIQAADATAAHTTPALLANQWADKIRHALVDQASIQSYVAQLSGTYTDSAPPVNPSNYASDNRTASNQAPYAGQQVVGSTPRSSNFAPPINNNFAPRPAPSNNGPSGYDSYNNNSNNSNSNSGYGNNSYAQNQGYAQGNQGDMPQQGYRQGRIAYAQVGQIIPATLSTAISTQLARPGDFIQATISQNVTVGDSVIPAGSLVIGQVTEAKAGGHFTHSGELQIKFNRLRLPDGSETPISAHITGGIGKYSEAGGAQSDQFQGETMKNKVGSVAFRGLLGAGGGAALGTAVGAIAGGGHGAGRGAWSGTAIGGGLGVADSLILRKGADVTVRSGTNIQIQLDAPVAISGVTPAGY